VEGAGKARIYYCWKIVNQYYLWKKRKEYFATMEAVEPLIFAIAKNNQDEILVIAKLQKFIILL